MTSNYQISCLISDQGSPEYEPALRICST